MAFDGVATRLNRWPPAKSDRLIELYQERRSASLIAEALGCTRNSVIGRIYRLCRAGLLERHYTRPKFVSPRSYPKQRATPRLVPKPRPMMLQKTIVPLNKLLWDLTDHECHWPVTDKPANSHDHFRFCGLPKWAGGGSYCEFHAAMNINAKANAIHD